jgi:hypothetical protein
MAHNLPHTSIKTKVIIMIDIPTRGWSLFFPFWWSFSLWGLLIVTRDLAAVFGVFVAGLSTGCEGEDSDRVIIDTVRRGFSLTSGEPGWLVPVLIASIFRQKDNRFLHVASFVVSTWSESFPFSRMMSCSEDLYHVWNRTIISYLQVMLTYAKVCSIMLKYAKVCSIMLKYAL